MLFIRPDISGPLTMHRSIALLLPPPPVTRAVLKQRCVFSHLVTFLMESSRHLQQRAPLVQRGGEGLPLLLKLTRDLFDLLRRIVAGLQQPVPHRHNAVNVHVHILHKDNGKRTNCKDLIKNKHERELENDCCSKFIFIKLDFYSFLC